MVVHFTLELTVLLVVMEIALVLQNLSVLCSILSHGFCFTFLFLLYLTSLFHGPFFIIIILQSHSHHHGLYKCFIFQKGMYPFCWIILERLNKKKEQK